MAGWGPLRLFRRAGESCAETCHHPQLMRAFSCARRTRERLTPIYTCNRCQSKRRWPLRYERGGIQSSTSAFGRRQVDLPIASQCLVEVGGESSDLRRGRRADGTPCLCWANNYTVGLRELARRRRTCFFKPGTRQSIDSGDQGEQANPFAANISACWHRSCSWVSGPVVVVVVVSLGGQNRLKSTTRSSQELIESPPCDRPLEAASQPPGSRQPFPWVFAAVTGWGHGRGPQPRKPTPIPVLVPGVSEAAIISDK
jgi:hypothetical protein